MQNWNTVKYLLVISALLLLTDCSRKGYKIEGSFKDEGSKSSFVHMYWFSKDSTFLEETYEKGKLLMANRGKYLFANDTLYLIDFEWRTEQDTNYSGWQKRTSKSSSIARPGFYRIRNVAENSFDLLSQGFDDHIWVTYERFSDSQTP